MFPVYHSMILPVLVCIYSIRCIFIKLVIWADECKTKWWPFWTALVRWANQITCLDNKEIQNKNKRPQWLLDESGPLIVKKYTVWKKCYMKCGVWNQLKIWSSHLLDNLSNCLMNLKNSGDSTGFEPMTSAIPVQCSNQLSYEVTQLRAGQFVGLMFSRERNVVWKKCYMKCGVWNQLKIWSALNCVTS